MINITDRTKSLKAIQRGEMRAMLDRFFAKISRVAKVEEVDLVVRGDRNSVGETIKYAASLVVKFRDWKIFRVEAAEGGVRATIHELINRVSKQVRRKRRDEIW